MTQFNLQFSSYINGQTDKQIEGGANYNPKSFLNRGSTASIRSTINELQNKNFVVCIMQKFEEIGGIG